MLSLMHKLVLIKLLQGPAYKKVEALLTGVRMARTCLKAVGAKKELFASSFTIGALVDKLANMMHSKWFHHLAEHQEQVGHETFKMWLELEAKAAVRHRQKV